MATGIKAVPGYAGAVGAALARSRAKKTPSLGDLFTGGYSGAGWTYPQGATGPPTTYKPLPAVSIPQAASVVPPSAPVVPSSAPATPPANPNAGLSGLDEYTNEIKDDPMYSLAEKNYNDALAMGERSQLADPFRQAMISYGYDLPAWNAGHPGQVPPTILDEANKYIDPAAAQAARDNPYSTAAQIEHSFGQAIAGLAPTAAVHGTMGGGGQNIAGSNLLYQRGGLDKQAMDQFLGALGTANQNWVNFQNQQRDTFRGAQEDIATRLAQLAGYHALLDAQGREVAPPPPPEQSATPSTPMSVGNTSGEPTGYGPGGNSPSGYGAIGVGDAIDSMGALAPSNIGEYPFLNPDNPQEPFTPVRVGSSMSFEPKPAYGTSYPNTAAPKTATQKAIQKVRSNASSKASLLESLYG